MSDLPALYLSVRPPPDLSNGLSEICSGLDWASIDTPRLTLPRKPRMRTWKTARPFDNSGGKNRTKPEQTKRASVVKDMVVIEDEQKYTAMVEDVFRYIEDYTPVNNGSDESLLCTVAVGWFRYFEHMGFIEQKEVDSFYKYVPMYFEFLHLNLPQQATFGAPIGVDFDNAQRGQNKRTVYNAPPIELVPLITHLKAFFSALGAAMPWSPPARMMFSGCTEPTEGLRLCTCTSLCMILVCGGAARPDVPCDAKPRRVLTPLASWPMSSSGVSLEVWLCSLPAFHTAIAFLMNPVSGLPSRAVAARVAMAGRGAS